jgi:hypothetical protein
LELRAVHPLAKGAEAFISYINPLSVRSSRQEQLRSRYGFECQCEMCALPDDLSRSLDVKMKSAIKALIFLDRIRNRQENNFLLGARLLEILIDIVTQERIFDSSIFLQTVTFFALFGRLDLLEDVGLVLLPILKRYFGTGEFTVKVVSRYLEDPSTTPYWEGWDLDGSEAWLSRFHDYLRKVALNIISCLKNLP